jgi:hypothetical protein
LARIAKSAGGRNALLSWFCHACETERQRLGADGGNHRDDPERFGMSTHPFPEELWTEAGQKGEIFLVDLVEVLFAATLVTLNSYQFRKQVEQGLPWAAAARKSGSPAEYTGAEALPSRPRQDTARSSTVAFRLSGPH